MKADYKKLHIACWITLMIFYLFTILTGNTITMTSDSERFKTFCTWVDGNIIIKYILQYLTFFTNWLLVYHAIHRKKLFTYKFPGFVIFISVFWILKTLLINYSISNYIDFIIFAGMIPFHWKNWYRVILICLYVLIMVIVTSTIKGVLIIGYDPMSITTLEHLIFGIDLFLLTIILYLNSIKNERW